MNINRIIISTILEICFLVIFVIITIPVWKKLNENSYSILAKSYSIYTKNYLSVYVERLTDMKNINENENSSLIGVYNVSENYKNYNLYLVINKTDVDVKSIRVSIQGNTYFIQELRPRELEDKTYYLLDSKSIGGKKTNDYEIFISVENQLIEQYSDLDLTFEVEETSLLANN